VIDKEFFHDLMQQIKLSQIKVRASVNRGIDNAIQKILDFIERVLFFIMNESEIFGVIYILIK